MERKKLNDYPLGNLFTTDETFKNEKGELNHSIKARYFSGWDSDKYKNKLEELKNPDNTEYIVLKLLSRYDIILEKESNNFYCWNNGYFEKLTESMLKDFILNILEFYNTEHPDDRIKFTKYMFGNVKLNLGVKVVSISDFDKISYIINVKNGLIDLRNNRCYEHRTLGGEHYFSQVQFPVNYDPDMTCPKIHTFLEDVFGADRVSDILEMIGYIMSANVRFKKSFLLFGITNTGKTTFIESLLLKFLGRRNSVLMSIFELSREFKMTNLRGKRLCYNDELPEGKKIINSNNWKMVCANEYLGGSRKFIQEPDQWINATKCIFGTNFMPELPKKVGDEFFGRWAVVLCDNVFEGENDDKNIRDKITTPEEFSGLLNLAIFAYQELIERGKFRDNFLGDVRSIWTSYVNPVKNFIDKWITYDLDGKVLKDEFLVGVNDFRKESGQLPISMTMCTQSCKILDQPIFIAQGSDGKRWYRGIIFKTNYIPVISAEKPKKLTILDTFGEEIIFGGDT